MECFLFSNERTELYQKLAGVLERKNTDKYSNAELLQILLHGEKPEIYEKYNHNKLIFKYVQDYLVKTKRLVYKSKNQYVPEWNILFSKSTFHIPNTSIPKSKLSLTPAVPFYNLKPTLK